MKPALMSINLRSRLSLIFLNARPQSAVRSPCNHFVQRLKDESMPSLCPG